MRVRAIHHYEVMITPGVTLEVAREIKRQIDEGVREANRALMEEILHGDPMNLKGVSEHLLAELLWGDGRRKW